MKKLVGAVLVVLLIWSLCMAIPVRATESTEFTAPTLETEPVSMEETALATEEPTLPTEETILETRPQVLPQKPEAVSEETEATVPEEPESPWKTGKIAAGAYHSVWIREDGTVGTASGSKACDQWKNIHQVAAWEGTLGLTSKGKVVADGSHEVERRVASWQDIVDIDIKDPLVIGLTKQGTVALCGCSLNVSSWRDIVDVADGLRPDCRWQSAGRRQQ